jgi:hypothetical protein
VKASRRAGSFRHRCELAGSQVPFFDPQLESIPWLHPESVAKVFREGDLSFATDGHGLDSHWNDYSKIGGLQRDLMG